MLLFLDGITNAVAEPQRELRARSDGAVHRRSGRVHPGRRRRRVPCVHRLGRRRTRPARARTRRGAFGIPAVAGGRHRAPPRRRDQDAPRYDRRLRSRRRARRAARPSVDRAAHRGQALPRAGRRGARRPRRATASATTFRDGKWQIMPAGRGDRPRSAVHRRRGARHEGAHAGREARRAAAGVPRRSRRPRSVARRRQGGADGPTAAPGATGVGQALRTIGYVPFVPPNVGGLPEGAPASSARTSSCTRSTCCRCSRAAPKVPHDVDELFARFGLLRRERRTRARWSRPSATPTGGSRSCVASPEYTVA